MGAESTAGKQRGRPFQPGQSGNPNGRPKGSRNATTLAMETLLDGQAEALTNRAIELALGGDMQARRSRRASCSAIVSDGFANFMRPSEGF
jgi:hypothetical protein